MKELLKPESGIIEDPEAIRLRELRQERRELDFFSHILPSGRERRAKLDQEIADIRAFRESLMKSAEPEVMNGKQEQFSELDVLRSKRDQLMAELGAMPTWKLLGRNGVIAAIADVDRKTAKVFNHARSA